MKSVILLLLCLLTSLMLLSQPEHHVRTRDTIFYDGVVYVLYTDWDTSIADRRPLPVLDTMRIISFIDSFLKADSPVIIDLVRSRKISFNLEIVNTSYTGALSYSTFNKLRIVGESSDGRKRKTWDISREVPFRHIPNPSKWFSNSFLKKSLPRWKKGFLKMYEIETLL